MSELANLQLAVRYPDGRRQQLTVDAPTALVGSGSHCEIRLPPEDAAVEQLRLSLDAAGIFGQVRNLERSVTLNGVPFLEGRVLPDSLIMIGRVELVVSLVETVVARGQAKKKDPSSSAIYALGVVGFPLGFYLVLTQGSVSDALPSEVEPPPLFAAASAQRCPEPERDAALAIATEELRRAETARERAPFSGQDAVGAVAAFQRAATCFAVAEAPARATDASHQAEALKRGVEAEFHVHRVRLERALATKSYEEARTEVRLLLAYTGRRSDAYSSWLLSLDRQIELKFAGKKQQ